MPNHAHDIPPQLAEIISEIEAEVGDDFPTEWQRQAAVMERLQDACDDLNAVDPEYTAHVEFVDGRWFLSTARNTQPAS